MKRLKRYQERRLRTKGFGLFHPDVEQAIFETRKQEFSETENGMRNKLNYFLSHFSKRRIHIRDVENLESDMILNLIKFFKL